MTADLDGRLEEAYRSSLKSTTWAVEHHMEVQHDDFVSDAELQVSSLDSLERRHGALHHINGPVQAHDHNKIGKWKEDEE